MANKPIRSWIARYRATDPKIPLLGGVYHSQSSRWGEEQEAHNYSQTTLEINRAAGRPCDGEVIPSHLPPEIFTHCGRYATAINCRCHGCGKVLTQADAKAHKPIPLPKDKP